MFRGFKTIFLKEVIDNLRDRRTLTTMGISILVGPLMMFGFLWFAEKSIKEETDLVRGEAIALPVIGADLAPNLIAYLAQNNFEILEPPSDPKQAIASGEQRMVLEIGSDYVDAFEKASPAPIRLYHDSSLSGLAQVSFDLTRNALHRYGSTIAALRLQARGINPQIMQVVQINLSDVAEPEARNTQIVMMLPYLIVIFIMVGGMYLATYATAGERENGSLEPLLCQPVRRRNILLAKLAATIFFSAITLLLVLVGLSLAFVNVPIDSITVRLTSFKIVTIFMWCLPFVCLAGALMVLVACFTKSYKEAQSYLGMIMLVPSLPLIVLGFLSPQPSLSNMWVPSLSQGLMIIETIKGEPIGLELLLLSAGSSLLLAAVLATIAVRLYKREQILG